MNEGLLDLLNGAITEELLFDAHAVKTGARIPLDQALEIARELTQLFKPYSNRTRFAGSIRRKKSDVGDVDVVVELKTGANVADLKKAIADVDPQVHGGEKELFFEYKGVVINLFILQPGSAMGAPLLFATGPGSSNIGMRAKAKKLGFTLNQYGLWKDGERVASTERDIRTKLDLAYKKPTMRESNKSLAIKLLEVLCGFCN